MIYTDYVVHVVEVRNCDLIVFVCKIILSKILSPIQMIAYTTDEIRNCALIVFLCKLILSNIL